MTIAEHPSLANERARRRHSFKYGYIPPDRLVIDPSLPFHNDENREFDVITEEVVRSKLWNLNSDHGETIRRVSGSNIVVEGYDFNCSIATEMGDAVTFSTFSMFFAGFADEVIKWTLEHRSMNVGIRDGDLFLQDDPWVGSNHQMDTAVFGPVFVDGKLFAWIFNCIHQREVGGSQPGGMVQDAVDVHTEPTFMPPIKLVEGGVMKEDVVDAWTRRSRLPELMTLELNSQVAGYNTARRRLFEIIDRYGAATVKGVMRKMIDDTSSTVGDRLRGLPDATWRDERYVAGATQRDRRLYRVCMTFDKKGDRLLVSNEGTDPAVGSFNTAPGVFRAAVLNGLLPTLAYDQYLCAAGVLRQIDFDLTAGAITTASHPSAVSTSMGSLIAINQAHCLGGKMLSGDPELVRHAFATTSGHSLSNNSMFGVDQYGNRYADTTLDTLAGGIGAFSHRDGIDFGGRITGVGGKFSDVERFEQVIPFLFVYRRELPYSGGHGRWRGGVTLATAWVGHKTTESFIGSGGLLKSVTTGLGLCGGYPATSGSHWHATDADIQQWFSDGRVPGDPVELRKMAPHGDLAPPKKYDNRLGIHDVFELVANPGAGWGDPLERDPDLVETDLLDGRVRANEAEEIYGVVVGDLSATTARRDDLRAQRLVDSRPARVPAAGTVPASDRAVRVIEGVALATIGGAQVFACVGCGQVLGGASRTYRLGCCELDLELTEISELFTSPLREIGEQLVFRRYLCPGCGRALDGNVCRPDDEPFCDVKV